MVVIVDTASIIVVSAHVAVHVTVGGERDAADATLEGPLARMHQHVSVQRAGRAEQFAANAAAERLVIIEVQRRGRRGGGGRRGLVMTPDVQSELVLVLEHRVAHGTHVLDVLVFALGASLAAARLSHNFRWPFS